ncbi:hypothetical protein [Roseateles paludis]|jgi:hypothetical protein|uniref:Uncharacterized protein n=1 Tax=Roseateles paludis TaxID=3145238 RepID=A0ABV0G4T5_9BURK
MHYRSEAFYEDVEDLLTPVPAPFQAGRTPRGFWAGLFILALLGPVAEQWLHH